LRDVADPLQDGPAHKMSDAEASGGAISDADAERLSTAPGRVPPCCVLGTRYACVVSGTLQPFQQIMA